MNTTTIEQACDPSNWRWKRWDVRADGKVFWQYGKSNLNGEYWTTWDNALKLQIRLSEYQRKRYSINKDLIKDRATKWRLNNPQKYKEYRKKYESDKRKKSTVHCLKERVRVRVRSFINRRGHRKNSNTISMLGCDWSHLKAHLESKFTDGMSWENRGMWHVDHIIPLASAKSIEEVVRLCHYTNLQPLWAKDNLKKGAKIQ